MNLTNAKNDSFLKMDTLIIYKKNDNVIVFACPGQPLKQISIEGQDKSVVTLNLQESNSLDFLNAVKKTNNGTEWYPLLIKEWVTKAIKELRAAQFKAMQEEVSMQASTGLVH